MRLGKLTKKTRGVDKAGDRAKPHYITSETIIGQISPDLISTYFAPKFKDIADQQIERYAGDLLDYQDILNLSEAGISVEGTIHTEPPPPVQPLFHSRFVYNDFAQTMADTSEHFFAKSGGWRVNANAAMFERMLDEKYGIFRPFMTNHPELESFVRSVQRKYVMGYFSPFRQGSPPIPRSTAIVILFMMKRGGVQWEIVALSALFFLIGLQPWALVAAVILVQQVFSRRKRRPFGSMPSFIPSVPPYYYSTAVESLEESERRRHALLLSKVGEPSSRTDAVDTSEFDTILLGHGPPALFTASLLSRAGRKVLVLSARSDASGCLTLEHCSDSELSNIPFDIDANNISKISKQQEFLAPALCTSTDFQGGIRFAEIGSDADGHAFEILSIPGVGTERKDQEIPFVLKGDGGVSALMEDTASLLGDGWPDSDGGIGSSTTGAFVASCEAMNATASHYYMSKILPESTKSWRKESAFEECAVRFAAPFLSTSFPLNTHLRSLMAGIGMKGENVKPNAASMAAHVGNICAALSGEGMHYPIGGPRALCKAFANVIERAGGRILTGVEARELLFEEDPNTIARNVTKPEEGPPVPKCIGVVLADGRSIRFETSRYKNASSDPGVISLLGFIDTFVRLLPEDVRTKYKVPRGLPALSERRPVFKVLFALRGSASELSITGADYYRLPNASVALDQIDPATGIVKYGEIGGQDDHEPSTESEAVNIVKAANSDEESTELSHRRVRGHRYKFHTGVSWLQISFPSAKDPSFENRHGKFSTCVVTIEADDDFVTAFDTKPKLFVVNKETAGTAGDRQRLLERVTRDLTELYPQLVGKIVHSEVRGPYQRGLSHNPERYAAKGVRTDTPYPRLFVGGSDLTIGESFAGGAVGGWLVANAVLGYSAIDHLFLQKNITSDLVRFLERPILDDDEELAVPYKRPSTEIGEDDGTGTEADEVLVST